MRALIHNGQQPAFTADLPEPHPEPGEALIRTRLAAISRTDREICQGLFAFTGVLGQQFVGAVESVGNSADRPLIGRRVVGSIVTHCGTCELCQAGLSRHCRNRSLLGMDGRDGCLAECFTLPTACLTPIADDLDDDHAVFAQPVAAAIQAVRQLTIQGKPYITVLGDGPLGLIMVQLMTKLNASVRLIGRYSEKLSLCEKWSIKHRHVDDIGRRADQDVVIDCTGSPSGLELAMQLVRPLGKVLCKSLLSPSLRLAPGVDLSPVITHELELVGSFHGPINEAVTALQRGEVDVLSLISKRVSLKNALPHLSPQPTEPVLTVLVQST